MPQRLAALLTNARRHPRRALVAVAWTALLGVSATLFLGTSEDVLRHNGAARLDAVRLRWISTHRAGPLVTAARLLNTAASVAVLAGVALLVALWLWRRGLPLVIALAPVASLLAAEAVAGVLKVLVHRSRPPVGLHLVSEADASFPSGHATAAAALGVSLAIILSVYVVTRVWARVVAVGLGVVVPTVVALSRLELGVHWPTDVVAGLALGTGAALAAIGPAVWLIGHGRPTGTSAVEPRGRLTRGLLRHRSRRPGPLRAAC